MARLETTFNPDEVPESDRNYTPIPAGEYLLQIVEADVVETKDGTGKRMTMRIDVVSGEYEGRPIFEGLNIQNANPTAQSIAQRQLADLCLATGAGVIEDTDDLLFKPFRGKIGIQTDKNGVYEPKNVLKRIIVGNASAPVKPAARPAATPPKGAPKKPTDRPWA